MINCKDRMQKAKKSSKCKYMSEQWYIDLQFLLFLRLFEVLVSSVIDYEVGVWGDSTWDYR